VVPPGCRVNDYTTISSTSSVATKEKLPGIRYDPIDDCYIEGYCFESAAAMFNSLYGCCRTKQPAAIEKEKKSNVTKIASRGNKKALVFICSCGNKDFPTIYSKVRLMDMGGPSNSKRHFEVQLPIKLQFDDHFYTLSEVTGENTIPTIVRNKIANILQVDPLINGDYAKDFSMFGYGF
jgi:hypothetical protein